MMICHFTQSGIKNYRQSFFIVKFGQRYLGIDNLLRPSFGTFMDGKNVYNQTFSTDAVLVMGNEANGIRPETAKYIQHKIGIPRFGGVQQTESLNVAATTAIFLSEMNQNFTEK